MTETAGLTDEPFTRWREDYATGIALIDDDHQVLVHLINALHDVASGRESARELSDILAELSCYVIEHFDREERLMAVIDYEGLEEHILQHRAMTDEVGRWIKKYMGDPGSVDVIAFLNYLSNWLLTHILQSDQDFAGPVKTWLDQRGLKAQDILDADG